MQNADDIRRDIAGRFDWSLLQHLNRKGDLIVECRESLTTQQIEVIFHSQQLGISIMIQCSMEDYVQGVVEKKIKDIVFGHHDVMKALKLKEGVQWLIKSN